MKRRDLTSLRLRALQIERTTCQAPGEVVSRLGAMQAQDYPGALWSVGLRLASATQLEIEQAIGDRSIIRTWPMRGTLHFVAPRDVRWMLELLTPRVVAGAASRHLQLELTPEVFARGRDLVGEELQGGRCVTRQELCQVLERHGISTAGQRGIHIFWRLAQEGLICFGPQSGKRPTFVLLEEWVPPVRKLGREEALLELARRYFTSHGPATLRDFVWWSGLKVSEARAALGMAGPHLSRMNVEGRDYWMSRDPDSMSVVHGAESAAHDDDPPIPGASTTVYLLPGFDEYMLGYTDRGAALGPEHAQKIVPGNNGMFVSTIVIDGRIRGTWRRAVKKGQVVITPLPFQPLNRVEIDALGPAAERYGRFVGMPAVVGG